MGLVRTGANLDRPLVLPPPTAELAGPAPGQEPASLTIPAPPVATGAELNELVRTTNLVFTQIHELRKTPAGMERLSQLGPEGLALIQATRALHESVVRSVNDGTHRSEGFQATVAELQRARTTLGTLLT